MQGPHQRTTGILTSPAPSFLMGALTENVLALSDTVVLLSDLKDRIFHCSKSIRNVLGLEAAQVVKKGWPFLREHIHPCDRRLLRKKLLPELAKFVRQYDRGDRNRLVFSYTFRIRLPDSHYILLVSENQIVDSHNDAFQQVQLSVLKNITPFATPDGMTLVVRRKEGNSTSTKILERVYPFQAEGFSPRQSEIIRWVAKGLSSREIAERIFVSPETVRCHRKNIMRRSGSKSSAELVAFALREGII